MTIKRFAIFLCLCVLLFVCFLSQSLLTGWGCRTESFSEPTRRDIAICVIYAYYEKDEMCRENLRYFVEHGLQEKKEEGDNRLQMDYHFVVNGPVCSVNVNPRAKSNVHQHFRENRGYDFAAYSHVLKTLTLAGDIQKYDYFVFLNSSVRGPFYSLPSSQFWPLLFLQLFRGNVHLVGTSINIHQNGEHPHVQSMFFMVDRQFYADLQRANFFDEELINGYSFDDLIQKKEIGLSDLAIRTKGYNINCMLPKYRDLDYVYNVKQDINPTSHEGDPYYPGAYFGESIRPADVVFFKTNRGIAI